MDCPSDERGKCLSILKEISEEKVDQLFAIWQSVGYTNVSERAVVVCKNVQQLLSDMVEEETENQIRLADKIEELLKEGSDLCREVGGDYGDITARLEDMPLLELDRTLNERLGNLRKCKEDRMKRYNEILEKEHLLCVSMGLKKRSKLSRVPREEDIEELLNFVAQLEREERELKQTLAETKMKIDDISSELGVSPETSFHRMLVGDDTDICLSSQNMRFLKELHQCMEQKLERAKSESIELREKLSNLWERLHVPFEERDVFLQQYPGHSMRSIDALKREIRHCEEKKRQNIRVFVEAIRQEVADWWDKCCFGKAQRLYFRSFYSDCYTEDLLELHEIEVEKLKKYFCDNRAILDLAKKREKLWKQMIELDERAHDPKRLFANRGGQLLREEKERKAIQKDLPVIEKELISLLDAYERKIGVPFYFDGEDLKEVIKTKWDTFQKKKEDEKLARKMGKDHTVVEKTLSATKRKLPAMNTPMSVPNKKATPASAHAFSSASRPPGTGSKVVRSMFNKPKTPLSGRKGIQSPEASYSHFEVNLEKHSADQGMVRSSVVPSRLLRERNGQSERTIVTACSSKGRLATPTQPLRKNNTTRSCNNLSEFRTPQAPHRNASPGLSRSRSAPRLAAVRGRLPIII